MMCNRASILLGKKSTHRVMQRVGEKCFITELLLWMNLG